MQEIFTSDWYVILIASVLLGLFHIYFNKNGINFKFSKNQIPIMILIAFFLWISFSLFNSDIQWVYILIPIASALLISSIIQSFRTNFEFLSALITFISFFLLTKLNLPPENPILAIFSATLISTQLLTLLKTQELNNNIFSSLAVSIPLFAGTTWVNSLGLNDQEVISRHICIMAVVIISIAYSFAINNLKLEYKWSRIFSLVIAVLLTYLFINNFLLLPINFTLLVITGLIISQGLELISLKTLPNPKSYALTTILALGIILSSGFIITRLFGVWGLAIISACLLSTTTSKLFSKENINWPAIASMFFSVKVIVHILIISTTLNITGLNLNHPYVYVGLILGIFLPVLVIGLLLVYNNTFKAINVFTVLSTGVMIPILVSYLLHTEAIGAMILAVSVSSICVSIIALILGSLLNNETAKTLSNAILPLSALMGIITLINHNLFDIGEMATKQERIEAFVGFVVISTIVLIVLKSKHRPQEELSPLE